MSIVEIVIITLLSIIQSIFGVGLLIIGTSVFLQLGYEFYSVLNILLPFSILISFLQFLTDKSTDNEFKKGFLMVSIPFLIISLMILKYFYDHIDIIRIVALVMIVFSIVNLMIFNNYLKLKINRFYMFFGLGTLGILHGFTNLGGSLLTLLSSNISQDKIVIRSNISFGYLVFGLIQISYIALYTNSFTLINPIYLVIPLLAFFISQSIYHATSSMAFSVLLNMFILLYGIYILI